MQSLAAGTILDGRYRVDEPIGAGGFATVYAGFHLTLGVCVAIKVLHLDAQTPAEQQVDMLAAFVDEARLVTRLRHDHVVRTLDQGVLQAEKHSIPYVVLEWCGDQSLKERLLRQEGAPMPLAEAYAIIDAVTDAIAHAHELGVVHRDIKPGNVMLASDPSGEVVPRVIDFGIAKLFESDEHGSSGQTMSRSAGKFTPAYAAPEQLAGLRTGPWTDVHAIGLLFFELVSGRAPFASGSSLGGVDPERPTPARVGIDVGAFEPVIARAVSLRPGDRYADARALRRALHDAARTMSLSVPRLPIAVKPADRETSRRRPPPRVADDGTTTEAPISQTARTAAASLRQMREPERAATRRPAWIAAGLVGVVAVFGTVMWLSRGPTEQPRAAAGGDAPSITVEASASSRPSATPVTSVLSALAVPSVSTYVVPSSSTEPLGTVAKTYVAPPKHAPIAASTSAAPEPSHAPIASGSTGIGGIVEKPPF